MSAFIKSDDTTGPAEIAHEGATRLWIEREANSLLQSACNNTVLAEPRIPDARPVQRVSISQISAIRPIEYVRAMIDIEIDRLRQITHKKLNVASIIR